MRNDGGCDGDDRHEKKMKAGEEGKVICHNGRDGGGGGQTSAASKWTKVKEIIFVSTDDDEDDAKRNRVSGAVK